MALFGVSSVATAGAQTARVPQEFRYELGLYGFLHDSGWSATKIVNTALANNASAWRSYTELLDNSFKTERFVSEFRRDLGARLNRLGGLGTYRAAGEIVLTPEAAVEKGGSLSVTPRSALDFFVVNPDLGAFGKARPALLIERVIVDFPQATRWRVERPRSWTKVIAQRDESGPLKMDAVYDYSVSDCIHSQAGHVLRCHGRILKAGIRARRLFQSATVSDQSLIARLVGPVILPER